MIIEREKTVAFSGHRSFKAVNAQTQLFGSNNFDGERLAATISEEVTRLAEAGIDTFLCGMAEGFDLLAADAVLSVKAGRQNIRLIAVVPYPGQADRFDANTKDAYQRILDAADEVTTICANYSRDCFYRRNDFLVDNSSALICYYNGTPGGTAYTVKRALRRGIRVINTV